MDFPDVFQKPWFWPVVGGGLLAFIVVAVAIEAFEPFSGSDDTTGNLQALPNEGDPELLANVTESEEQGREHVAPGASVDYAQIPPTSGPHYGNASAAGFYENPQPYERLVHSLEHGAVVIYYDPNELSPDAEQALRDLGNAYTNAWASVIAVPQPEPADFNASYVLTAWTARLEMGEYSEPTVRAFLAEYLGRGPENPIR